MFCREFCANHSKITRNLKIICRSIGLLNKNTEGLLGVEKRKNLTTNYMFKVVGEQSVLLLTCASQRKHTYSRSIHNSIPTWTNFNGPNQKKEELKNYIFMGVVGGICLIMFVFSMTMRTHEDYVYVNPNVGKK